jgi:hypothetical protein
MEAVAMEMEMEQPDRLPVLESWARAHPGRIRSIRPEHGMRQHGILTLLGEKAGAQKKVGKN